MAVRLPLDAQRQQLFDELEANAVIIDHTAVIRAVNRRWREFAAEHSCTMADAGLGCHYLCWDPGSGPAAGRAAEGIMAVIEGATAEFALVYPCETPAALLLFRLLVVGLDATAPRAALVLHVPLAANFEDLRDDARHTVSRLGAMVTICAWCSLRRRVVDGTWFEITESGPPPSHVSHGVCPECLERLRTPA